MNLKNTFTNKLFYVLSAGILATSITSYANDSATLGQKCESHFSGHKMHGDWTAHTQKRLDKLKADLKIQPTQENTWLAYANTVKAQGEKMKAAHQQAQANTNLTLPEQLDQRISFMKQHEASMEETAGALKTLYNALTPEQRGIMDKHFSHGKHRQG